MTRKYRTFKIRYYYTVVELASNSYNSKKNNSRLQNLYLILNRSNNGMQMDGRVVYARAGHLGIQCTYGVSIKEK